MNKDIKVETKKLQKEIYQWKLNNFGNKAGNGHQNLLGVIEEIGELAHAVLKKEQGIRNNEEHNDLMKDAIGDIFIFLMNYLSDMGIEFDMPFVFYDISVCDVRDEVNVMNIYSTANDLVSFHSTMETFNMNFSCPPTKISVYSKMLVKELMFFCCCKSWDFEKIVIETWEQVKKRNWKENKINGVNK
jgi:NTP pyrophosphatase (non-canonical NTP hydrolase)